MPQQGVKKPKSFLQPFYQPPTIRAQEARYVFDLELSFLCAPFFSFCFYF